MAEAKASVARPLSPHLQVYRLLFTMVMSIVHRITGAGLYVGTLLLAWYLIATASGPEAHATVTWFMGSLLGRLILFGYTWALFHHMLGGLRHFVWDFSYGFDPVWRMRLAQATLGGSIALTILTPLADVRGLGSAKSGTGHFVKQRVTAASNAVLVIAFVFILVNLVGKDYAAAKAMLARPIAALPLLLFIASATYPMRIGMQVIIEDYVHRDGTKIALLVLNTFFAIAIFAACGFAILKIAFGA
jgi:succinate dehydrogenase / fumarate reductase cytochrome b subunit